jgi:hypothetical protein
MMGSSYAHPIASFTRGMCRHVEATATLERIEEEIPGLRVQRAKSETEIAKHN